MASWHSNGGGTPGPESRFDWVIVHWVAMLLSVPCLASAHPAVRLAAFVSICVNACCVVDDL